MKCPTRHKDKCVTKEILWRIWWYCYDCGAWAYSDTIISRRKWTFPKYYKEK